MNISRTRFVFNVGRLFESESNCDLLFQVTVN